MIVSPQSRATPITGHGQPEGRATWATQVTPLGMTIPLLAVLGSLATLLGAQTLAVLAATHGHLIYPLEAPYTHLALASQILTGNYGLSPGVSAAPSSSILYPFVLAALRPLGLGALLPLVFNTGCTLAAGWLAVLLARECRIALHHVPAPYIFVLACVIGLSLGLPGLALTGLEHSFHVAMTIAYLLGLVRFVMRGRCDWWWFACIIIQPIVRFEAAGMLVADALIFVAYRRYGYALAMVAIGAALVGGYSLFLHSLGLPVLPSSVLARSDWSNAATVSHSGLATVIVTILKNVYENVNSFGAAQMLTGVAVGLAWLAGARAALSRRPVDKSDQVRLVTLAFMVFVTAAQIVGGKLGWKPARYEAYVLVLNVCGLAVIYRERVSAWCEQVTWRSVSFVCVAMLLVFAGYATQPFLIADLAGKEYQGPYQLHRFVTQFYRQKVAVDQVGYINFENPYDVVDLSGLASETARRERARSGGTQWMDDTLARNGVGLAIMDTTIDEAVPVSWTRVAELRPPSGLSEEKSRRFVFYARQPGDVGPIADALGRFAATAPTGLRLLTGGGGGD